MGYDLDGQMLDFCTCGDGCYCQMQGEGDDQDCRAVNTWHIKRGTIGGTDVSGLTLVMLSTVPGHVLPARPVKYYVDQQATAEQVEAMGQAWSGKLGGPLADLAQLSGQGQGAGRPPAIERTPITYELNGSRGAIRVGQAIAVSGLKPGQAGTGEGGADICTSMQGSQGMAGMASSYRIQEAGADVDLRDCKVVYGSFHFQG